MPNAERTWTITELAHEYGVTLRTIRFYEEQGLLSPERRGTQRIFHAGDHVRLGLVLRGKRLGFPLDEIKTIIGMYDAEHIAMFKSIRDGKPINNGDYMTTSTLVLSSLKWSADWSGLLWSSRTTSSETMPSTWERTSAPIEANKASGFAAPPRRR